MDNRDYIHKQLERATKAIADARAFVEKYPAPFPEHGQSMFVAGGEVLIIYTPDAAAAGKALGKQGWIRSAKDSLRNGKLSYDWTRIVDGVKIIIQNAECHDLTSDQVPPSAFPIMLEYAAQ